MKFGMQVVLASRKPVTRPVVVRADPDLARASPECHRSTFWGMGREWKAEIGNAGGIGH